MKQETDIKDKSLYWWTNLPQTEMVRLRNKYFPNRGALRSEERLFIYKSEHQTVPSTPVKDAGQNDKQEQTGNWEVADYKTDTGERFLAIWAEGIKDCERGSPICVISPKASENEIDFANAELIVKAVNSFPAMYEALKGLIAAHEDGGNRHYNDEYNEAKAILTRINKD